MAQSHHHEPGLSTADSVRRNIVRRSSLEDANRIYRNLTQESILKDGNSSPSSGRPYPFFVPSTVKSTLGSPVRIHSRLLRNCANAGRLPWQLEPFLQHLRLFRSVWWDGAVSTQPMYSLAISSSVRFVLFLNMCNTNTSKLLVLEWSSPPSGNWFWAIHSDILHSVHLVCSHPKSPGNQGPF